MEEKQTQQIKQSDLLPHLKNSEEALSAITNLCKDLYHKSDSTVEEVKASNTLLESLYQKARELGAKEVEVATAALSGMPKNAQQDYFKELEGEMLYGFKKGITPQDLLDLRQKFGL